MSTQDAALERDRAMDELAVARQRQMDEGIEVLRARAALGKPFSANDVRDELRAVGIESRATGGLFYAAIKANVLRKVGRTTSDDPGTHHKDVATYVAGWQPSASIVREQPPSPEEITVPVKRDGYGRFRSTPSAPPETPLLDLLSGGGE